MQGPGGMLAAVLAHPSALRPVRGDGAGCNRALRCASAHDLSGLARIPGAIGYRSTGAAHPFVGVAVRRGRYHADVQVQAPARTPPEQAQRLRNRACQPAVRAPSPGPSDSYVFPPVGFALLMALGLCTAAALVPMGTSQLLASVSRRRSPSAVEPGPSFGQIVDVTPKARAPPAERSPGGSNADRSDRSRRARALDRAGRPWTAGLAGRRARRRRPRRGPGLHQLAGATRAGTPKRRSTTKTGGSGLGAWSRRWRAGHRPVDRWGSHCRYRSRRHWRSARRSPISSAPTAWASSPRGSCSTLRSAACCCS